MKFRDSREHVIVDASAIHWELKNAGSIVTGCLKSPVIRSASIYVESGTIRSIGHTTDFEADIEVDLRGMAIIPGLIDTHGHPVFGDYSPRSETPNHIARSLLGGTTSIVSAGAVHLPGRPMDRKAVMALAYLAHRCYQRQRPSNVKVHAGTLILSDTLTEGDFADLAADGIKYVAEILGSGNVKCPERAAEFIQVARKHGLISSIHVGPTVSPRLPVVLAEHVLRVQPNIVCHINGGPTSLPDRDVARIIDEFRGSLEIVYAGNVRQALLLTKEMARRGELSRLLIGTDTPSGHGSSPLALLSTICVLSSMSDIPAEQIICVATGNAGKTFKLHEGRLHAGAPADLLAIDSPANSVEEDPLLSIARGDIPAIALIMIDGTAAQMTTSTTPPPRRRLGVTAKTRLGELAIAHLQLGVD